MDFEQVKCDRCGRSSSGYYTLSSKIKGLYVQCQTCGNHAAPYNPGFKLPWKPSKTFLKEVGSVEAARLAQEAEKNGGAVIPERMQSPSVGRTELLSPDRPTFYCDAGTKNNGQYGKQQTVVLVTDVTGKVLIEEWIGDKTNNEGELVAIIRAATIAPRGALILSDSDLAVKWIGGQYRTKIDRLKPLIYDAISAVTKKNIQLKWISRDDNLAGHYIEYKHSL
ncbi:MAG: hypothetical protein Q8P17_04245 [bacterium]|nr:hypothetical protein [bacterium]